jgi:2,3-bisphosphoglycerate-independent phosphoglycerate mutase
VPLLLWNGKGTCDDTRVFSEKSAAYGSLGRIEGPDIMPLIINAAKKGI